jgi:hypothetical protein
MVTTQLFQKKVAKCTICGVDLIEFIAYVPGKGEACMFCYIKAAKKDEDKS